jgi:hypothetical protein
MASRTPLPVALLAVPLAAQSLDPPALPAAAEAIKVMPDARVRLKYHFLAVGKQIYNCENGTWSKSSTPAATLYDMNSNLKVRHSAGPSWTTVDGKSTVKALGQSTIHFASPDRSSIDWLKLDVDRASRTGEFSDVGIVQRLYTGAGTAPATACAPKEVYESAYTAHYYFWVSK